MLPAPPSCAVDETKLRSPRKSHHPNRHGQHKSHAQTPTRTLATIHLRLLTLNPQTQHTTVNEAATDPDVPTLHLISTSPSPDIQTPSASRYRSKNQIEALHHQIGVHQIQCLMAFGWRARRRILVLAASGCLHKDNRAVFTILPKRRSERGTIRVGDTTPTIRIPRARIQDETEKEIGREIATKRHPLHQKSADGRRI